MSAPTSDAFGETWQVAVSNYEQITGKRLGDLDLKRLQTVDDLERAIDSQSTRMDQFRAKRATLFRLMRNAMLPIQLVGDLAAGGATQIFPPSSFVFGAVTYLIGAAKNVSSAYDAIQDLMSTLQDFTVRLKVYNRERISLELSFKLTKVLTTLLEILALARKVIKRGRFLGFMRNVVLRDKEIQGPIDKLARLTESEDRLVGAETHSEVTRQGETLDGIASALSSTHIAVMQSRTENREIKEEIMMMMEGSRSSQIDSMVARDKVKAILQPSVTPQDTFDQLKKARLPGSGEWIHDESLFDSWISRDLPVLWVSGMPGAGKSFLSSAIISYLKDQYPPGAHDGAQISIAYFFFKDNNPKTRSFHQALRDLAFQIYQNDPVYAKYLDTACGSPDDIETIESAWRVLFREFFIIQNNINDSGVFLILDGLDEAFDAERNDFLDLLQEIRPDASSGSRIQLVMVGRPHLFDAISDALQGRGVLPTIDVDGTKTSEDIRSYIQSSIRKSRVLKRVSKKLQDEVVESLSAQANGMFLWVDLMMRELNGKSRESAIREALNKAPKGLTEMIRHVLEGLSESLSEDDAEDLNELLAWVTCAKRPLKLGELDAILRYKSATGDPLVLLESKLRRQYASFFTLAREDGLSTADLQNADRYAPDYIEDALNSDEETPGFEDLEIDFDSNPSTTEVTFCHASIGDFFRTESQSKVRSGDGPAIGVDINAAKADTLRTLFQVSVDSEFAQKVEEGSFFKTYVGQNWLAHLRDTEISKTSVEDLKFLGPMLIKFCRDESIIEKWAGFRGYDMWTEDYIPIMRKWIDNKELLNTLPQNTQEWVRSTSETPASTFEEVAKLNARHWLQSVYWLPEVCFWSVYGYRQHINGLPLRDASKGVENPQVIEESAEWAGYEKTATWHRRIACTFREHSYSDEAEAHFNKAIELDPRLWRVKAGLAQVYAKREDYAQAAKLYQQEIQIVRDDPDQEPANYVPCLAFNLKQLGNCYSKLNDSKEAYEAYQEAWSINPELHDAAAECFSYLDRENQSRDVMKLVKEMAAKDDADKKSSYFVNYLVARNNDQDDIFFSASMRAARETGEIPDFIKIVQEVINFCRNERRAISAVIFELFLADIYYDDRVNSERAIRIWERIMNTGTSSKSETLMAKGRKNATLRLASCYFARAMDTKGTLECNQHVESLERLGKSKGRAGEVINLNEASVILGLWYRLNGKSDKASACFRAHVKYALQILSDDDPTNDIDGYIDLATLFLFTGDIQKSLGIWRKVLLLLWQVIHGGRSAPWLSKTAPWLSNTSLGTANVSEPTKPLENSFGNVEADDKDSEPDNKGTEAQIWQDDDEALADLHCDGICSHARTFKASTVLWLCIYCYDTAFCDDCYTMVKEGRLPINRCSPSHEWVALPLSFRYIPDERIFISGEGDDSELIEDWKNDMRKTWGL